MLVFDSLPERASDLDLLVRPLGRDALTAFLAAAGFSQVPAGRVRIAGGLTAVVDLTDVAEWGLEPPLVRELFDSAVPLPDAGWLVRPSAVHSLLILARRFADSGGRLDHRRLARGRRALDEEPDALEGAAPIRRSRFL